MAIIGNFTKQDNAYQGTISTLSVNAKATITPVEKTGDQSPDFRVFAGKAVSVLARGGNSVVSARRAQCPITWSSARA